MSYYIDVYLKHTMLLSINVTPLNLVFKVKNKKRNSHQTGNKGNLFNLIMYTYEKTQLTYLMVKY